MRAQVTVSAVPLPANPAPRASSTARADPGAALANCEAHGPGASRCRRSTDPPSAKGDRLGVLPPPPATG